jgi:hypothetical protein
MLLHRQRTAKQRTQTNAMTTNMSFKLTYGKCCRVERTREKRDCGTDLQVVEIKRVTCTVDGTLLLVTGATFAFKALNS